ncbi:MAG: hypothetical protein JXE06_01120 [Coriobacteriia bacterium]|nr:hypothetical protein [Coriobacteriia bacterium]MBN2822461.1 hypothetical protein [Coriobacteriia bacterium]
MRKPKFRLVISIALLIGLLLVVTAIVGSSPTACGACHTMSPYTEALQESAHSDIACYECHLPAGAWDWPAFKTHEVLGMYPASIIKARLDGAATMTSRTACLKCHSEVLEDVIEAGGIRIQHDSCAPEGSCDSCHSTVAHGESTRWILEPAMEDCIGCHRDEKAPTTCDLCHAGKTTAERLSRGSWAITHGPEWETTHGMGDLRTCDACHDDKKCASCHDIKLPHPMDFGSTHPAVALENPESCETCHDSVALCDACHGISMPHPEGFLSEHSKIATGTDDAVCIRCHKEADCVRCHVAHTHPGSTDGLIGAGLPETGR